MNLDLARRALAAGLRWAPGMRSVDGRRVLAADDFGRVWTATGGGGFWYTSTEWEIPTGMIPDLDDPGTRGHLLEQVRERMGDPFAYCGPVVTETAWKVWSWTVPGGEVASGITEAAALVAARERSDG